MRKKRILIVFGGRSAEHEVSICSARSIIQELDRNKYRVFPLAITKKGKWLSFYQSAKLLLSPGQKLEELEVEVEGGGRQIGEVIGERLLKENKIEIVFPVLHGPYGEDGTFQGMLEMFDITYVGSGVLASALGMSKIEQKKIFAYEKLPILPWQELREKEWEESQEKILKEVKKKFTFPLFVKPSNLGSSIGITKAHNEKELIRGIRLAFLYDTRILIEKGIEAREIECSVLGGEEPCASLPGEILPSREFYDYEAKYLNGKSRLIVPAQLPEKLRETIQKTSCAAFRAIDCFGMARVDFLLEKKTNRLYLNEINTIPGFTKISMYPKLWEVSGLSYQKLLDKLIDLAEERHWRRKEQKVK